MHQAKSIGVFWAVPELGWWSNHSTARKISTSAELAAKGGNSEPISELIAIERENIGDDPFSQVRGNTLLLGAPTRTQPLSKLEISYYQKRSHLIVAISKFYPSAHAVQHGTICCRLYHWNWGEELSHLVILLVLCSVVLRALIKSPYFY
jgi:hypothetical protein